MKTQQGRRNLIGPQIRRERIAKAMSQGQLAVKLQLAGVFLDRGTVAKIECGLRSAFDYELTAFAKCLEVPVDSLFPPQKKLKEILPALIEGKIPRKP